MGEVKTKVTCEVTIETATALARNGEPYKATTITVTIDSVSATETFGESSFGYGFERTYKAACEAFASRKLAEALARN